ncbi:hypothetical protein SUDANB171_03805 [Streptomyces sp. enrichment culture]|uniref:hypothetical protein n=1 Tax=Streptomyces sp. enrichment culture TaxID=1795815 RepID=UPI003F55A898
MLRKLSGNTDCVEGSCPTLWGTEDGNVYVLQGYVITDPQWLAQLGLPEGEAAVKVPAAVLEDYFHAHRR